VRCLCKRVDVYIITLSCTWRIYALSERLLVVLVAPRPYRWGSFEGIPFVLKAEKT